MSPHSEAQERRADPLNPRDRAGDPGALFVSFWHIGFENIPEGTFAHRCLEADDAKTLIEVARSDGTLFGVSENDLFSPDEEAELRNHGELCRVLEQHYGITLSMEDFVIEDDLDGEVSSSLRPLAIVDIGAPDRLLVVNCSYIMASSRSLRSAGALQAPGPTFELDPESVSFHLFEASGSSQEGAGAD